jgi:phosphoadenosine phosphosulfate reductase
MPNLFPESLEYWDKLVSDLGLRDTRRPAEDHGALPGDCNHSVGLWTEDPDSHTRAYMTTHLNEALADFDCWIAAAYHFPYPDVPGPRVVQEGRLIRIDPLASWSQTQVREFMQEHGLSYHPLAMLGRTPPPREQPEGMPTYDF